MCVYYNGMYSLWVNTNVHCFLSCFGFKYVVRREHTIVGSIRAPYMFYSFSFVLHEDVLCPSFHSEPLQFIITVFKFPPLLFPA
ncbi:hypothetical protein FKM82_018643 [Ascaphus truei]